MSSLIDNFTDLTSSSGAIATWLRRTGDTNISNNAADFVALCEDRIAYGSGSKDDPDLTFFSEPLRIRPMETPIEIVINTPVSGGTVGGTANAITLTPTTAITSYSRGLLFNFTATADNTGATTVAVSGLSAISLVKGSARSALTGQEILNGGQYNIYYDGTNAVFVLMPELAHVPLPSNYLAMREWFFINGQMRKPLNLFPPQLLNSLNISNQVGEPKGYTIVGDAIRFIPDPDTQYFAPMVYYQKFAALASASGGTNWLLTNAPRVYLNGSLLEACIMLGDDNQAKRYLGLYRAACNALQSQDERDRHSGAAMQIRNDTGNP